MVWQIDFVPKGSPAARGIIPTRPIWRDAQNGSIYPVFNVRKGTGRKGRFTYPRPGSYGGGRKKTEWAVDRPGVLVATAGHLHPGGLHTDLRVRRHGRTAPLFRSVANEFAPGGACA